MPLDFSPFLDQVPDYEVREDIIHVSVAGTPVCSMRLIKFEAGMARAARVIAEYRANKADLLRFRREFPLDD